MAEEVEEEREKEITQAEQRCAHGTKSSALISKRRETNLSRAGERLMESVNRSRRAVTPPPPPPASPAVGSRPHYLLLEFGERLKSQQCSWKKEKKGHRERAAG